MVDWRGYKIPESEIDAVYEFERENCGCDGRKGSAEILQFKNGEIMINDDEGGTVCFTDDDIEKLIKTLQKTKYGQWLHGHYYNHESIKKYCRGEE